LSGHVNVGIESVMSLEQYEDSKKLILNNNKYKRDEKGIIALVFTLITSPFFAQAVFDKFDGQDDVTSIIVKKKCLN
jgi:hypothetical protein